MSSWLSQISIGEPLPISRGARLPLPGAWKLGQGKMRLPVPGPPVGSQRTRAEVPRRTSERVAVGGAHWASTLFTCLGGSACSFGPTRGLRRLSFPAQSEPALAPAGEGAAQIQGRCECEAQWPQAGLPLGYRKANLNGGASPVPALASSPGTG